MSLLSRGILVMTLGFGWACSDTETASSDGVPGLPERTTASQQTDRPVEHGEPIQRPAIPVAQSFENLCRSPAFAPVTISPVLESASRRDLLRYLSENSPIRSAGQADTIEVQVWVCVDEAGRVQNTAVAESSGSEEIDAFAEAALTNLNLVPAELDGQRVPTWISLPVVLGPG